MTWLYWTLGTAIAIEAVIITVLHCACSQYVTALHRIIFSDYSNADRLRLIALIALYPDKVEQANRDILREMGAE
jgi:hypothetical protein